MSELRTNEERVRGRRLARRWIAALRSGAYLQTTGRLRSVKNEFCCLGVLCDLIDPQPWDLVPDQGKYAYHGNFGFPPQLILNRAGVSYDLSRHLAEKNDAGHSFLQIATEIEERLGLSRGAGFAKFRAATLTALQEVGK